MATARKSTEERQREIIEATLDLIAELGVQGLTTARLAERIGLSEASLYRHFDGKLDIVRHTIETIGQQLIRTLMTSAGQGTPSERLRRVLEAQLAFIEKRPGVPRILFSDEIHYNSEALREKLYDIMLRYSSFIENVLSEGVATGEFRDDLDLNAAAQSFLGLVQTQVLLWSLSDGRRAPTDRVEELWAMFQRGVSA